MELADNYFGRLKTVLYTGNLFYEIPWYLTEKLDAVVAGPFEQLLHTEGAFPASSNQKVYYREGGEWIEYVRQQGGET